MVRFLIRKDTSAYFIRTPPPFLLRCLASLNFFDIWLRVWKYIHDHGLQDGRTVRPDELFHNIAPVDSFDMDQLQEFVNGPLS